MIVGAADAERAAALARVAALGIAADANEADARAAIAAVPDLISLLPDDDQLDVANRIGLLVQSCVIETGCRARGASGPMAPRSSSISPGVPSVLASIGARLSGWSDARRDLRDGTHERGPHGVSPARSAATTAVGRHRWVRLDRAVREPEPSGADPLRCPHGRARSRSLAGGRRRRMSLPSRPDGTTSSPATASASPASSERAASIGTSEPPVVVVAEPTATTQPTRDIAPGAPRRIRRQRRHQREEQEGHPAEDGKPRGERRPGGITGRWHLNGRLVPRRCRGSH